MQKGPFITGSTIIVQELNDELSPNGISFNVTTEDNFGSFSLNSDVSTDYIEIISTGFYFNEVSGEVTNTNLTLRAISNVSYSSNCNVNILTTLAKKRIVYLIHTENKSYFEAKQQAQEEILSIFSIVEPDAAGFEAMNISEDGDSNGILLAISAILQGSNSVSELSVLISTIIEDIKTDGVLNNTEVKNEIIENAKYLSLPSVRNNIETRYTSLGLNTVIPDFEQYINNIYSNDPPTCDITKLLCRQNSMTLYALAGDPLIIGSQAEIGVSASDTDGSISKVEIYFDNVLVDDTSMGLYNWTITDTTKYHTIKTIVFDDDGAIAIDSVNYELYGFEWINTTTTGQWVNEFSISTLNSKMFVYEHSKSIIYSSSDGTDWIIETGTLPWTNYATMLKNEYDGKIWVIGDDTVWNSTDGVNWLDLNLDLSAFVQKKMFLFNNKIYAFLKNFSDEVKIYEFYNNEFIQVSNTLFGFGFHLEATQQCELNDKLYIYPSDGSKSVMYSSDLVNWTIVDDVLPWMDYEMRIIGFNNKMNAFWYSSDEMWSSLDGLNWNKEFLQVPLIEKVFIFKNTLWLFAGSNNGSSEVYYLEKYFD